MFAFPARIALTHTAHTTHTTHTDRDHCFKTTRHVLFTRHDFDVTQAHLEFGILNC
jgi:hypothetical protein